MIKIKSLLNIIKSSIILLVIFSSIIFISCASKINENNIIKNQDAQATTDKQQIENNTIQNEQHVENNSNQNENQSDNNSVQNKKSSTTNEKPQDKNTQKPNNNAKPASVLIDAPLISQLPELKNGCEITSLTMMLNYTGIKVDKMTLAKKVDKDTTPITYNKKGKITNWGDPDEGFVGDMSGKKPGYSVDPEPLVVLVNEYMPNKAIDLTGASFEKIQETLSEKRPIVVWVTCNFKNPVKNTHWDSDGETINATFSQHAVLLTGYDEEYLYYNDPLTNTKNKKVSKTRFIQIWSIMGKKALSYKN